MMKQLVIIGPTRKNRIGPKNDWK